ncbi:hypothetical protein [Streptomyces malaysiense]|uniref:Extensin n=1 Tax=Streptomyces malaysiense TaxID=1428626 RepID=A0A1J4Q3W4_9ACTN|nr:hypothetical protein [Streptomyces malaysiense]OIK27078.1 hypothetical protein VT52_012920 [Streptomyces malaysiense]
MADEQDKWLNPGTAERLLDGEPLEAVDPSTRDQAERLARVLDALSVQAAPATCELPGEQAALAAFRKAREAAADERTAALAAAAPGHRTGTGAHGHGAGVRGHDAGLVRIGAPARRPAAPGRRPGWGRPVRLALAAVLAAGTLGGVAMAAGGVLPTPFEVEKPGPAATATTDSSARPSASATPRATGDLDTPGGGADAGPSAGAGRAGATDGRTGTSARPGTSASPGGRWNGAINACRDLRSGTGLGADRRRALENLAGGSARLTQYCKLMLAAGDHAIGSTTQGKSRDYGGQGSDQGQGGGSGQGGDGRGGDGKGDDESHPGTGHGTGRGTGKSRGGDGSGGGDMFGKVRVRRRGPAAPAPAPTHAPRHTPPHAPRGGGRSRSAATPRPAPAAPTPAR